MSVAEYTVGLGGLAATIGAAMISGGFLYAAMNRLFDGTWTGRHTWRTAISYKSGNRFSLVSRLAVPTMKAGALLVLLGGTIALIGVVLGLADP